MIKPKLSIIVPIYNVEKYLDKCILSILNQDYKDFELILVNDGSPDRCEEICNKYLLNDRRVRLINKANGGLSSARNAGLDIAKGEYIGFVDSDDWIEKEMYSTLMEIVEKNGSDIVQCEYYSALYDTDTIKDNKNVIVRNFTNIEAINNMYGDLQVSTTVSWNKIYKRSLFDGIRFPIGKLHEDEFTTYKLLYRSNKISYINKELYYYRQTPNSIMNLPFSEKRLDIIEAFEEKKEFIKLLDNKKLYLNTIKSYNDMLINVYYACKRDMKDNTNHLKNIKNIFNKNYFEFIFMGGTKIKHVIKFTIFFINTRVYKYIKK